MKKNMSKQFLGELKWVAPGESGQQRLEDFLGASYRGQQPGLPNVVPGFGIVFKGFDLEHTLYQGNFRTEGKYGVVINRRFLVANGRASSIFIGYTPKKDGKLFLRVVYNSKEVFNGEVSVPGHVTLGGFNGLKKEWQTTPDGKGFVELKGYEFTPEEGKGYELTPATPPPFHGGMTQGLGQAEEQKQQRLVDFIEGEAKLSQSRFLGEVQWLGAIPSLIKKWFPERTDAEWNGLSQADQFTFSQQASAVEATWNAKINEMRANGACDATKPGLLAGAMREYLIKSGGLLANMDDLGAKAFGPKDCLEWVRVFGKAPDQETVAKGIGLATGGATPWVKNGANGYSLQVTVQSVCPNGFKLPSCAVSPPPPPTACDNSKCPPGTECCQENWTEGDLANCAPGTCVNKCPDGYTRAPTGVCKPVAVASSGTSSSGLGLLVLGSAALGLAFFASKSELAAIPKHPSQKLQANKSKRRRRR